MSSEFVQGEEEPSWIPRTVDGETIWVNSAVTHVLLSRATFERYLGRSLGAVGDIAVPPPMEQHRALTVEVRADEKAIEDHLDRTEESSFEAPTEVMAESAPTVLDMDPGESLGTGTLDFAVGGRDAHAVIPTKVSDPFLMDDPAPARSEPQIGLWFLAVAAVALLAAGAVWWGGGEAPSASPAKPVASAPSPPTPSTPASAASGAATPSTPPTAAAATPKPATASGSPAAAVAPTAPVVAPSAAVAAAPVPRPPPPATETKASAPAAEPEAPKENLASDLKRGWDTVERNPSGAAQVFLEVLGRHPGNAEANYGYGYSLLKLGEDKRATKYLCAARSGDPGTQREVTGLLASNGLSCP